MGEKSYLKGYAKALDPSVRTKHKSKSWLRGFIDATERSNCSCRGKSIFGNSCNNNKSPYYDNYNDYFEQKPDNNMLYMFNNIINRLINLIQQTISRNSISQNYNNYNNIINQNTANTVYDNDIINTYVNGINNSVYIDA